MPRRRIDSGATYCRLAPLRDDQNQHVPKDDRLIVIEQTVDDALDGLLIDDMKKIGDLL